MSGPCQYYLVNKSCWIEDAALKTDVLLKQRPFGGISVCLAQRIWCPRLTCMLWAVGRLNWFYELVTKQCNHQKRNPSF